jgi:uncharacterized membrane protein YkvA (DUF1232 family)
MTVGANVSVASRLRAWAKRIKRDGVTLWFASRHAGTPWYAKAIGLFVVAYALSPIDLIPDFIPVLGYVDDVLLLPGLIWLALRLTPTVVLTECRHQADGWTKTNESRPKSLVGAVVIVALWVGVTVALWHYVIRPWLGP